MISFAKLCGGGALFIFWFIQTPCSVASVPADALQHHKAAVYRNSDSSESEREAGYVKNLMLQRKHKHVKISTDLQGLA